MRTIKITATLTLTAPYLLTSLLSLAGQAYACIKHFTDSRKLLQRRDRMDLHQLALYTKY